MTKVPFPLSCWCTPWSKILAGCTRWSYNHRSEHLSVCGVRHLMCCPAMPSLRAFLCLKLLAGAAPASLQAIPAGGAESQGPRGFTTQSLWQGGRMSLGGKKRDVWLPVDDFIILIFPPKYFKIIGLHELTWVWNELIKWEAESQMLLFSTIAMMSDRGYGSQWSCS